MYQETSDVCGELLDVVRVLLLMQGAIATVSTVEALVGSAAFGAPISAVVVLSCIGAVVTLWCAARIGNGSRRVRKLVIIAELTWLTFAGFDLALSLLLTQTPLELVPTLTRIVLPVAVIVLLRRPQVRGRFGVTTRRERRAGEETVTV